MKTAEFCCWRYQTDKHMFIVISESTKSMCGIDLKLIINLMINFSALVDVII